MRRTAVLLVAILVGGSAAASPVWAYAPSDPATTPSAVPGEQVCAVTDRRVFELSGLAATTGGYLAVNDSAPNPSDIRIFRLDTACRVQQVLAYPSTARDPEDLAVAADGTVWVADIGDNNENRATVAMWTLAPTTGRPVIHRLTYPDGPHDAEAMLMAGDNTPIIITKEATPGIYRPAAALAANTTNGVSLTKVGELRLPDTSTPNPLSFIGRKLVTGAAKSPDGTRVVVRTYADAFEWDVPDGDVIKAITSGPPRITPLPDEPQGEAIAYTADGTSFITVSDLDSAKTTTLLRYRPTQPPRPARSASAVTANEGARGRLTLEDITSLIAAVGVLSVILVFLGVIAIRRSRRRRAG